MFLVGILVGAMAAGLANAAEAQSLKVKQLQQTTETRLSEQASDIGDVCGKDIPARLDWDTFEDADYEGNRSIAGYCSHAVTALREVCRSELGKQAVQAKLTALECARGAARGGEITETGVYRYKFTWQDADQTTWHIKFLQDNL